MKRILSAVAYCHSKKSNAQVLDTLINRDLKPENLVLESDDIRSNLKLIDFDTSMVFNPEEKMKGVAEAVRNGNSNRDSI